MRWVDCGWWGGLVNFSGVTRFHLDLSDEVGMKCGDMPKLTLYGHGHAMICALTFETNEEAQVCYDKIRTILKAESIDDVLKREGITWLS